MQDNKFLQEYREKTKTRTKASSKSHNEIIGTAVAFEITIEQISMLEVIDVTGTNRQKNLI